MPRLPDIYIAGPRNPDGTYDKTRSVILLGPPDTVAAIRAASDSIKEERRAILMPPPDALPGTHALVKHRLKVMHYFLDCDINRMVWADNPITYERRQAQREHVAFQERILYESARLYGEITSATGMAEVVEARCIAGRHERLQELRALPGHSLLHIKAVEQELRAAEELHGRLINEGSRAAQLSP